MFGSGSIITKGFFARGFFVFFSSGMKKPERSHHS